VGQISAEFNADIHTTPVAVDLAKQTFPGKIQPVGARGVVHMLQFNGKQEGEPTRQT
jgi:hypothetical protein